MATCLLAGCNLALGIHQVGELPADAAADVGPDAMPVAIDFVQVKGGMLPQVATSVDAPLPMPQRTGDLNVVFVAWGNTFPGIASVTDTNGNTYAAGSQGSFGAVWYAANVAAGSNTVTVRFNGDTDYPDVRVLEYTGIAASDALDAQISTSGVGATMTSGMVTTMHAYDLLVAGTAVGSYTTQASPMFTQRIETTPNGSIAEDRVVTAAGPYEAVATQSATNESWTMNLLAFKGLSDAPP